VSRQLEDVLKEKGIRYRRQVLGSQLSTFRIGGPVAYLLLPACPGELIACVDACVWAGVPYAVIGKGSNLLFPDDETYCAVIKTEGLDACRPLFKDRFYAQCGISLMRLSGIVAREGFADLAFACGIPGSLSGALFMNAGAYGEEMAAVVESVETYDPETGKITTLFHQELSYSYRYSRFQSERRVILSAILHFEKCAQPNDVLAQMRLLNISRRQRQPLELPNAGSAFRRPASHIAVAAMIDEMGLGGYRIGGAQISEKHTGFIVNTGGATAADVRALIAEIQKRLEQKYGYRVEPEIRFLPEEI